MRYRLHTLMIAVALTLPLTSAAALGMAAEVFHSMLLWYLTVAMLAGVLPALTIAAFAF